MADFREKLWHGLRGELLRTILLAIAVSLLLYHVLQPVSKVVLQSYYTSSDFLQRKTDAVGSSLQQKVLESGISSRQVRCFSDWYTRSDQPGGCILRVEKDGVVIYDSALNNVEYYRTYSQASKTLDEEAYLRTYPLEFSDGSATLYVYGYFDFAVDEAVRTAEFWLCLLLGIGIVLWAVWKKLNYMETLEEGIRVLEGGQLDYQVPVRGTDELAQMAQSLNDMSASLKQQVEQVQQAQKQRYELITSLSHDLRTPLTALLGYLEILAGDTHPACESSYLEKCRQRAFQIRDMINDLFEYFYVSTAEHAPQEFPLTTAQQAFSGLLCDFADLLRQDDFTVAPLPKLPEETLRVNEKLVQRIFDNLLSNIRRYADPAEPILIKASVQEGELCLCVCNAIRQDTKKGTGIGLHNCEQMMLLHQGRFQHSTSGKQFAAAMYFPLER